MKTAMGLSRAVLLATGMLHPLVSHFHGQLIKRDITSSTESYKDIKWVGFQGYWGFASVGCWFIQLS